MDLETVSWRILRMDPAPGAWNMAVDEAILESVGRGESLPTLRLYGWAPACLSLGYAQSCSEVDRARLRQHGWDLVRRPTGGRAILHVDELTYSVSGPLTDPRLAGGVLESYRRLAQALMLALQRMGLPATAQDGSSRGQLPGPVCFEVPSSYEITIYGKKLVGSAQARRKDGVLQHGSLPLHGDLTRIIDALYYSDESQRLAAAQRLLDHATTVETAMTRRVTWGDAADAFTSAFTDALAIEFTVGALTSWEEGRAEQLHAEKYANPVWTERV